MKKVFVSIILGFLILFNTGIGAEVLGRVYFDVGSNAITKESEEVLKTVGSRMLAEPDLIIDVIGYTDNRGAVTSNNTLSKRRAEAIKRYLIEKFKIPESRIYTLGLGPANPIASNDTEEGRRMNRRCEISIHPPDAILTFFKNEVFVQPVFLVPEWMKAKANANLYRLYKVNTKKKSFAEILFKEKGTLNLGEDALVIIYGLVKEKTAKAGFQRVELQSGALRPMLDKLSREENFVVNTPAALVQLQSKESKILVDKSLKSLVAIYEGKAGVSAMGKKVEVNEGEGTRVEKGKPPEPPRPLPKIPELLRPQDGAQLFTKQVLFKWQKTGVFTHLQLSKDTMFHELLIDTVSVSDSLIVQFSEGKYYWRLSGIDKDSLEGKFSQSHMFSIIPDTIKPELKCSITKDKKGNPIVMGTIEPLAKVFINDQAIKVNKDGSFSSVLTPDIKLVKIKAIDEAGNESKYEVLVPAQRIKNIIDLGGGVFVHPKIGSSYYADLGYTKMFSQDKGLYIDLTIGRVEEKKGDSLFATAIVSGGTGIRKDFGSGAIVPFSKIGAGFTWWRNTVNGDLIAQSGDRLDKFIDTSLELGMGICLRLNKNWFLNLHSQGVYFSNYNSKYSFVRNKAFLYGILGLAVEIRM